MIAQLQQLHTYNNFVVLYSETEYRLHHGVVGSPHQSECHGARLHYRLGQGHPGHLLQDAGWQAEIPCRGRIRYVFTFALCGDRAVPDQP